MKNSLFLVIALLLAASCKKDNYAAPGSSFKGRIVYQGEAVNVSQGEVVFELWESGWGKRTPINVAVAQDGSFSALLFDGNYQLVLPKGQGPYLTPPDHADTTQLPLKGDRNMDIEVLPYYLVRNAKVSASGRQVTATCKLDKIITDTRARNVERITLYVNRTQFVDGINNIAAQTLNGADIQDPANITLQVNVPVINPVQASVFIRIGVKVEGVEDMVFSPLIEQKL
ncbi:DUF3823 domain-containing protein [Chitinophaga qingshengii]|uniref:DUF3823 domain-containing protein n=1 Tax=Chitinophaga qingshengii TaxID=1569794 RepID=A0ABR7TQK5_9BACT|nr:DUF3823 domain-containing protein [Chitinophaga qingshengii]MBC9932268.1 DUF3823 domain-containing protein [Chitinophaga qingshengii]